MQQVVSINLKANTQSIKSNLFILLKNTNSNIHLLEFFCAEHLVAQAQIRNEKNRFINETVLEYFLEDFMGYI